MKSERHTGFTYLFKKGTSVFLVFLLIFLSGVFSGSAASSAKKALPLSAGTDTLSLQFESGKGGEEDGYAIDYSYYSPVGKNDRGRYPVVIFLHGIGHGEKEGSQLKDCPLVYWSSKELQSRWKDTGGAFLLVPRCPEDRLQYWNSTFVNPLRKMIDDFISEHSANIDTTRIFIGGSSAGGEMAWDMITNYPEYFAGAFPMSATGLRSDKDVQACSRVAIWIFASKLDPLVNYLAAVKPAWNKICKYSDVPESCRLSSFGAVRNPDGRIAGENHRLYQTIEYDFFTQDGSTYPDVVTENGKGSEVLLNYPDGIISWMSALHSGFEGDRSSEEYSNGAFSFLSSFFKNIIMSIGNIFQRILGLV